MPGGVVITPTDEGLCRVKGRIGLEMPSGKMLETQEETWLCRYGQSGHRPFCDGTHKKVGVKAAEGDPPRS